MTEHQSFYLLVYTGILTFAVLFGFVALGTLALALAKFLKQLAELSSEAKGKVYPILESVRDISEKGQHIAEVARNIATDTEPKIKRVTSNIADTSDVYRAKIAQVDSLLTDTAEKAHRQTDRVDSMLTSALTKTGDVVSNFQHAIASPFVKTAGLVSGARAAFESLLHRETRPRTPKPVAFEGDSVYTGYEDDYHA